MVGACKFVEGRISVDLLTAQYPEDRRFVPDAFRMTPDLDRSLLDVGSFQMERKLPLLADILQRMYEHSDAEWLIYTNVDIALQPHFYDAVSSIIDEGYDAFAINRRTISDRFTSISELPLMYSEVGDVHGGYDCFVFKGDLFPLIDIGQVALGLSKVCRTLLINLAVHAERFVVFRDLSLTFHIGGERTYRHPDQKDMLEHNRAVYRKIWIELRENQSQLDAWKPQEMDQTRLRLKATKKTVSNSIRLILPPIVFNALRSVYRILRGGRRSVRIFDAPEFEVGGGRREGGGGNIDLGESPTTGEFGTAYNGHDERSRTF